MPSRRNGEEWPLTEAEYEQRRIQSQRVTEIRRDCDCAACVRPYVQLVINGPRLGETQKEWEQVLLEASLSVARRMKMDINLRG